jgi:hypothetical protein
MNVAFVINGWLNVASALIESAEAYPKYSQRAALLSPADETVVPEYVAFMYAP